MRAAAARSAETSGGVGKPRWTPPRPPVPMKRIPTAAAAVSVPPTVVAPTAPWTAQTARSRGPSLRALGREPLQLGAVEPDPDLPVEHADRGRHGAGRAHGRLAREPRLDAVRRGEAVGDERRLERDDGPLLLERGLHLVADVDQVAHPVEPSQSRVAASSRRAGRSARRPRERAPARRRASRRRRRRLLRSSRRPPRRGTAARSSPSNDAPAAPRLRIQVAAGDRAADDRCPPPRSRRRRRVRAPRAGRGTARAPKSRIALHDERSMLTRAPCRARASRSPAVAAKRTGSRSSAYPETWRWSQSANHASSISSGRSSAATPRSGHIVRSPDGSTSETMTPFPAGSTGPDELDAELAQPRRRERAGVVGAALADEARAAAEGRDPGRDVRRLAARAEHDPRGRVGAGRERLLEPDDHVEHEVAEAEDRHRLRSSHGTTRCREIGASGAAATTERGARRRARPQGCARS